jgi:hypothetical protein
MKSFKQFIKEEGLGSGAAGMNNSGANPSIPGTTSSGGQDPIQFHIKKKSRLVVPKVPVTMPTHVTKEDVVREGTVADQKITTSNNAKTDPDPTGFVEKKKDVTINFNKNLKKKDS